MNKINGWMRLWILLSAFWAIFVSFQASEIWFNPPTDSRIEWDQYSNAWRSEYCFDCKYAANADKEPLPSTETVASDDWKYYKSKSLRSLVAIIFPPLFILISAYGAAWVRRGFRDHQRVE